MSFGRKGLQPGQAAPQAAGGFGRAARPIAPAGSSAPSEDDDMAAKRAAFIASERARQHEEIGGGSLPDARAQNSGDPMAHLRNEARPAQPKSANENWSRPSSQKSAQITARTAAPKKNWVFGHPQKRNIFVAYVLWYFASVLGVHRFYCGNAQGAWYQVGMFFGGLISVVVFAPLGLVILGLWLLWIIADLFLMPGMMRRFREQYAQVDTAIFE